MYSKKVFAFVFALITIHTLSAQSLQLNDLYIPESPGFVLADKAPSVISKPTNPKAFGMSILNMTQGGAVEASPYWFTPKPNLTYEQYIQNKMPVLETFNLSLASYKADSTGLMNVTAGFRTQLFRVYSKQTIKDLINKKKEIIEILVNSIDSIDTAAISKKKTDLNNIGKRGFFVVELAGALLGNSSTNSFNNIQTSKSGIWANIFWSPNKSILDFAGLVRYSWVSNSITKTTSDSSFLDSGMSVHYQQQNFDLSFEYINRRDFALQKNTDRLALVANYKLNDLFVLVVSAGKNFGDSNNIIATTGIRFCVGGSNFKL